MGLLEANDGSTWFGSGGSCIVMMERPSRTLEEKREIISHCMRSEKRQRTANKGFCVTLGDTKLITNFDIETFISRASFKLYQHHVWTGGF